MRSYFHKLLPLDDCPAEFTLSLIQGKWTLRLIFLLLQRPCYFGELKRMLRGISAEVLAIRLASLRKNGLVESSLNQFSTESSLSLYTLTSKCHSLIPAIQALAEWGQTELQARGVHWNPPTVEPKQGTLKPKLVPPVMKQFLLNETPSS